MKTSVLFLTFIVSMFLILTGGVCEMVPESDPVEINEIYGRYVANFPSGKSDILSLLNDSTYIRTLTMNNDSVYIDSGEFAISFIDKRHVSIIFKLFINRYTIEKPIYNLYYDGEDGLYDTIPRYKTIRLWKDSSDFKINYTLGERYGPAWKRTVKVLKK